MDIIDISKFLKNLSSAIHISIAGKSELIPTIVFKKISKIHSELKWIPIRDWDLFEYGKTEWGIDKFLSLVEISKNDEVQILSDCTYQADEAILSTGWDLENFEGVYERKYGEAFFQPLDYIIIKNGSQVVLIHHEGLIAFYS